MGFNSLSSLWQDLWQSPKLPIKIGSTDVAGAHKQAQSSQSTWATGTLPNNLFGLFPGEFVYNITGSPTLESERNLCNDPPFRGWDSWALFLVWCSCSVW